MYGEESTEEEYLNIILADDIFTNLSDLSQRVLCQLLVEYTCSIDDDGDELSFVLYFIQKINIQASRKVSISTYPNKVSNFFLNVLLCSSV